MRKMISFRIDDVCDRMNFDNFSEVMSLLIKAEAHPLLGVIPECRDEMLNRQPRETFDGIIHSYLAEGCEIAMHGYRHIL